MDVLTPAAHNPTFDKYGHQMSGLGTLACQLSILLGSIFALGALADLLLRPSYSIIAVLPVLGAFFLAPRSVLMQFPVSLSILAIITLTVGSVLWTIDGVGTGAVLKGVFPGILAILLPAGLLTLRDLTDAFLWTVRIIIAMTVFALIVFPLSRVHVGVFADGGDYAGWHGLFAHKNDLSPFLAFGIPTVLVFDKSAVLKWLTLAVIAVLMVGSTSATGITAGALGVVIWYWLTVYQRQKDARTKTLLYMVTITGTAAVVGGVWASIATITSAYGKDTSFSGRTEIWEASLAAIARKPILGYGFGGLFSREKLSNETLAIWRQVGFEANHAHNGVLDLALQLGLVGVAVFMVLWLSTIRSAWNSLTDERMSDVGIWVLSFIAGNFLFSLSEDVFFGGWLAIFAAMKMILMRRPESLHRPRWFEGPVSRWSSPLVEVDDKADTVVDSVLADPVS